MQVWRETNKLAEGGGWNVRVLGDGEKKEKKWKGRRAKKAKVVEEVAVKEDESDEESDEEGAAVEDAVKDDVEVDKTTSAEPTDVLITTPLRLIYAIKAGTIDVSK